MRSYGSGWKAKAVLWLGVGLVVSTSSFVPAAGSARQAKGEYIALGDSLARGIGASNSRKSYVQLHFGYLQSNGSGVTDVLNFGQPGAGRHRT